MSDNTPEDNTPETSEGNLSLVGRDPVSVARFFATEWRSQPEEEPLHHLSVLLEKLVEIIDAGDTLAQLVAQTMNDRHGPTTAARIFIVGIPGSGKTTVGRFVTKSLVEHGLEVAFYDKHDDHYDLIPDADKLPRLRAHGVVNIHTVTLQR